MFYTPSESTVDALKHGFCSEQTGKIAHLSYHRKSKKVILMGFTRYPMKLFSKRGALSS